MIRYTLHSLEPDGTVWTSPEVFEAAELRTVVQAVVAGFLFGSPRWAERADHDAGTCLYGLDAKGKPLVGFGDTGFWWHRRAAGAPIPTATERKVVGR